VALSVINANVKNVLFHSKKGVYKVKICVTEDTVTGIGKDESF
jgi:hypothetical protein